MFIMQFVIDFQQEGVSPIATLSFFDSVLFLVSSVFWLFSVTIRFKFLVVYLEFCPFSATVDPLSSSLIYFVFLPLTYNFRRLVCYYPQFGFFQRPFL